MVLFYLRVRLVTVISITQIQCPLRGQILLLPSRHLQTGVEKYINVHYVAACLGDDSSLLFAAEDALYTLWYYWCVD